MGTESPALGNFSPWTLALLTSIPAFFLVWIIYKVLTDLRSPLRNIPGPPGSLLLGNLAEMRVHNDFLGMMKHWSEQYGGIFIFRPLPGLVLIYFVGELAFYCMETRIKLLL